MSGTENGRSKTAAAAGGVLLTLASAQFLMAVDMSVMNVSIATVANDLGTTVTGIQTAITLYTLVMATLMITGGKIGTIIGRRRAFAIGCVIYAAGSLTTGLAPNLTVLIFGWSFLEGVGASLIMPAVVALVAGNFPLEGRARAYGLIAAAGAIAIAAGPLLGGAATTYASWRLVFFGEVVMALVILFMSRRIVETPSESHGRLDFLGTLLSITGLGMVIYGVLRSSEWGWISPRPDSPSILGLSLTLWFIIVGLLVVWLFLRWENRLVRLNKDPLLRPKMLRNPQLTGGLMMFFFWYLLQAGIFFIVPLFLSIVLGLTAFETGARLVPLSLALMLTSVGIPKVWPAASPRRIVRIGILLVLAGILGLLSGIELSSSAAVVAVPMTLIGLGLGFLASQLGAVVASSVPAEEVGEAGGLQNTSMQIGASLGTAFAGSLLILALTLSLAQGIGQNPQVPDEVKSQASVQMASGVPFLSDADLEKALVEAGVSDEVTTEILEDNSVARIDGLHAALAILSIIAVISLFFTDRIPKVQMGSEQHSGA